MEDKKDREKEIAMFRRGDYSSFTSFYNATARQIYLLSYSLLHDKDQSEDVLQDTYVKFLENLDKYQDGTNPYAFLLTIARNLSLKELEKKKRILSFTEEIKADDLSKEDEDDSDFYRMISPLDEDEKQIIVLHIVDDLSFKEIARAMKKPLSTILNRYNRAMKKLKEKEEESRE